MHMLEELAVPQERTYIVFEEECRRAHGRGATNETGVNEDAQDATRL